MKDLETIAQLLLSPEQSSKEIGLFLIKSQDIDIISLDSHLSRLGFTMVQTYLKNIKWAKGRHFQVEHHHIGLGDSGVFLYVKTTRLTYYRLEISTELEIWSNGSMVAEYEIDPDYLNHKERLYRAVEKLTQEIINHIKTL